MKKLTILLAIAMLTTQFVGCGLCRRFRDRLCRGAFCGQVAPAVAAPAIVPPPTIVAPTPPVLIPQAAAVCPQPCPQVVCQPICESCCDPYSVGSELAFPIGTPTVDSGWTGCANCDQGSFGGIVSDGGSASRGGGVLLPEGTRDPGPVGN